MSDEKTEPATLHVEASEETKPVLKSIAVEIVSETHGPGIKDRDPRAINSDVKVTSHLSKSP